MTLDVAESWTVGDLKQRIQEDTDIPIEYQRLLARGSKFDDNGNTLTSEGVKDRTKIILMHSPLYAQEKEAFETLSNLSKEIDDLARKKDESSLSSVFVHEIVTRICCRLDEVDTKGSINLRDRRKKLIVRAEALDYEINESQGENDSS